MTAIRNAVLVACGLALLLMQAGCEEATQVAPDDAALVLTSEADSLAPSGSTTVLNAVVQLSTGDVLPYDANVDFYATSGGLCAVSAGSCGAGAEGTKPLYTGRTAQGLARATYMAGSREGTVTIIARSGSVADTIQIVIKQPATDEQ